MVKMSTFTELNETTFSGTNDYICGYQSDLATTASNFRIKADDFLTWTEANIKHSDIASTAITSYLATMTFVGFNSADNANKEITFANILTSLESTSGLNLDSMYDSAGNHILSTRKGAIVSLTDSTGGTGTDTLNGYTITGVTDSTGGSTADATLAACTDTTATDQSATINANFAKVAVALNAIVSALNGDNDVSSLRDKIEEILLILRPTTGHALIS
jgi:hypothetical protein